MVEILEVSVVLPAQYAGQDRDRARSGHLDTHAWNAGIGVGQ